MHRCNDIPPVVTWATKEYSGILIIDDIEERGVYGIEVPYTRYEKQVCK